MSFGFAFEFDSESRSLARVEFSDSHLRDGEVLIRVTCCTICGSDLHTFTGRRSAHDRSVLGHEIIGEVVCWGGDQAPRDYFGEKIRPGQRVTWSMPVGCGGCFFCRNALSWKCDSLFKYGHEPGSDGIPTGGLSTHCRLIPKTPIFPIPDALPDEVACPANCATATVSATLRLVAQTHPISGASVVITGAGMLGLSAIAQLVDLGAKEIIAVDPHSDRRELARTFGATLTVDSNSPGDVEKSVLAKTDNRGVDVAIDFSGISSAVETCLKHLRIGGCVLLAGSTFPSESLKLAPEQIVRRMITLRGLHNYGPSDLEHALEFLERKHQSVPLAKLVAREFPLEQAPGAFAYALTQQPVRVAVRPGKK